IYNQWLLGIVENKNQYDEWKKKHPEAIKRLETWLARNPYRPVSGEFYNQKVVDGIFQKRKG
ncbi:MAG: hypothetical protein KDC07_01275, partial [Chitinophagaceae bacterium]|nr:hypothetical protein [Chitinophagaceae bacterium]